MVFLAQILEFGCRVPDFELMDIKQALFVFIFLAHIVAAEPVAIDGEKLNTSSVTWPEVDLKQTGDGRFLLNLSGGKTEEDDDQKSPGHFLWGTTCWAWLQV